MKAKLNPHKASSDFMSGNENAELCRVMFSEKGQHSGFKRWERVCSGDLVKVLQSPSPPKDRFFPLKRQELKVRC